MKIAIAKKVAMTQVFDEKGVANAGTVVSVLPMVAINQKTMDKDGYESTVFGFGAQKEHRINKPLKGVYKDFGNFAGVKEFKGMKTETGSSLESVKEFQVGDIISVQGTSKGKGFQGVVKRHDFAGGPKSHGQKHSHRKPGSIGGGGRAGGKVAKGMRMAGRMGSDTVTVKNLKVLAVDVEKNLLVIKGAVPGRRGSQLVIISK